MALLLAAALLCQEESLQGLMARWGEDDPARRDDASRRIVARWKEWKEEDLARLRAAAEGPDAELANRAKDALATIGLRRKLGPAILEKLPDAADLVSRGTPKERLTLLVRATDRWERGELDDAALGALARAGREAGWDLDGYAFLEHVHNRHVKAYVPLVVPYCRHPKPEWRGAAAREIGHLAAREHADAVARLLEDPDASVREAAVVSLGHVRATEHYPKLVPFLRAGGEASEAAFLVLSCAEARPAAPLVAERLSRPDEEDRLIALQVLGKMGAVEFVPRIAAFLKEPSPDARRGAATALGWMAASDQAETLVPLLADANLYTRTETVRALGRLGRADLVATLAPLLKEGGNEIAWTAAQAILDLGVQGRSKTVAELLGEPGGTALAMSIYVLGQARAAEYAKDARRLLGHHQPMVRAEAAKALALLDPAGCVRDLLPLLEDPFEAVRMDASLALSKVPAAEIPRADREAMVQALAEAKESFSGNARAAAAVAWLNAARPARDVQRDAVQMIQRNFSDAVADAMLDWLERTHEPDAHQKLDREIRLEKTIDSMEGLLQALGGAGVSLQYPEILSFCGRVPAGLRTTPRRLLARIWEGWRPVVRGGKVRVLPPVLGIQSWDAWLSP